jgi:hypothetical protein
MALVDLKSKLNQFRGGNSSVNPYEKGRSVETKLESNTDINTNPERKNLSDTVDGEGRQILGQSISTGASTFLKGLKAFGVDIPIENNYENSIKRNVFIDDNFGQIGQGLRNTANKFETARSAVSNFSNDPLGSINSLANIDQEAKLVEYRSKAYGKFRNYGSQASRVIRTDRDVAKSFEGPIKGGVKSSNVNKTNIIKYGTNENAFKDSEGLIPFRFKDVLNDKFIVFDAILSGITDTITPEYSSERYIGRPESVYVYQGVQRAVSFTFDVYPMTRQEMPVIWEKLNYLVGLCYPNWVDSPYAGNQPEDISPITMVSPICELTIGDMYNNTPGYLSGVTMTVQDGTTWEFEENMKLPHYVQVAVEFVYIGKYLPNAKGKHFELSWIDDGNDPTGILAKKEAERKEEEKRKAEAKKRWDLDAKKNLKPYTRDVRNIQNKETDLANYKISIGQDVLSDATG